MHGQNLIFNQPLAVQTDYLMSLLPGMVTKFRNNSFESKETIEGRFAKKLQAQMNSVDNGQSSPVIFPVKGVIQKYSDWDQIGTQTIAWYLRRLDASEHVSGILLDIDSGGGMVAGTAELADVIGSLSKPVISFTNGLQCSAAQWIASAADYCMAGPHADAIGSIGTLLSFQDFSAMFEKWGAKFYEVYAPESTEKNKEFRELLKGNEKLYKERLSEITQKFISTIKTNLPDLEDDGKVFKGKTYSPEGALDIGLIQEVGTLEDALSKF